MEKVPASAVRPLVLWSGVATPFTKGSGDEISLLSVRGDVNICLSWSLLHPLHGGLGQEPLGESQVQIPHWDIQWFCLAREWMAGPCDPHPHLAHIYPAHPNLPPA